MVATERLKALARLNPTDPGCREELRRDRERANLPASPDRKRPSNSRLARLIRKQKLRPGSRVAMFADLLGGSVELGRAIRKGLLFSDLRVTRAAYQAANYDTVRLAQAIEEYLDRRERVVDPIGRFDRAGRWYPDPVEDCENWGRGPTRAYPYSILVHCRSAKHCAWLYGVEVQKILAGARAHVGR